MKNTTPELMPQVQEAVSNSLIVSEELIEKGNNQTSDSKATVKPQEGTEEETLPLSEYIVCSGAKCQCTGNPSVFSTLSIKTHQKYYANAEDKLIATIEDNQFEEGVSPFKLCKYKKGNDKTCIYQAEGFWQVKENEHFPLIGNKDVLTETGKLRCVIGGELSIFTHGQTVSVTEEEVEEIEEIFPNLPALNGLLDFDTFLDTCDEVTYVSNVDRLELTNTPHIKIGALADGGVQALRVLKGEQLAFKATTPSGQSGRYINWSVTEALPGSNVLDAGKTGQSITLAITSENAIYNAVETTSRTFFVTPTQVGTYLVSAARKPKDQEKKPYYATFYYYLEVVEHASIQALELSNNGQEIRRGDEVVFTIHSDVELPEAQLDLLSLHVTVQSAHEADNIAVIYRAKGSPTFIQEGNKIKATFSSSNINVYRVQIYYNEQPLSLIPTQTFEIVPNKVLSVTPKVERIRLGSEVVFTAQLLEEENINSSAVNWRIKAPNSSFFQDYLVKNKIVKLSFPQVGKYDIECVYGSKFAIKNKYRHTIEVVDNAVERISLTPSIVPPKRETTAHGVYRKQMFTVALVLPLGYQPPTDGEIYVKQNEIEHPGFWKRLLNTFIPSKPASTIPRITNNRDSEISWRLSYVKGPKKKNGLNFYINYPYPLEEGEFSKEMGIETQQGDHLELQQLEGIFISRISTDKEEIELRSTIATLDFQLEEQGTYQLEVMVNGSSLSCEIECIAGRVNRWEFVDDYDQPVHYLSFNEDFTIATELIGFENTQASIAYWYDYRNRKKEVLELYRDTISFDSNGKGTHTVKKSSEFWKNFARRAPEGKGDEYAVFFTISEEIGLSNVKRNLFNKHEALEGFIFPLDTSNTYALISKSLRFEAYFNKENHQRLVEPRLYGQPLEVQVRRILGRYTPWASAPDALTLTLYENTNLNLWKLEFKDRKATSMDLKIEQGKNTVYTPMLNTCEDAVYKESTHEKDRKSKILPRVFYMGISYEIEEEVSYWGLKQIKKKVIEELFPRGYARNLANNDLLVNPLRSEIEQGISEKEREERIKANEDTIVRYRAEGKFGHQYLHQLKLVKEIAFGQAFTDKKIPVKVERAPHRLPDAVSHEKCPNCIAPVTVAQLENVYKISLRKEIGVDEAQFKSYLKTVVETYNTYMEELGMDTCHNKAMFFAISHGEVGGVKIVKNEEYVSYTVDGLKVNFINFQTKEGLTMAEQLGYDSPIKTLSGEALQKATANYAYKGINGNTQANDGWNYRGRGLMQLTGRGNYQAQRAYILSATGVDIIKDFEKVSSDAKLSTLTAMAYFNKNREWLRFKTSGSGFYYIMQQVGANPSSDRDGYLTKQKCYEEETTKKFKVPACSYKRELRVDTTIITYHIYHSGEIYKKFPKDYVKETYNQDIKQVQYIYYAADGVVHHIGIYQWQEMDELKNAGYQDSIPSGYSETFDYPADWSIDGQTAYYYKDKGKLTSIYVKGKKTKIRKYTTTGKKSKVIQVCPIQYESPTLSFSYQTYATIRQYCGIDQFAMFIGGFATVGINNLFEGTGITSKDGTGYPSVSHVNGQAMDMAYNERVVNKDRKGNNTIEKGRRITRELQQFIDAMAKFGCKTFRVGTKVKNNKEYTVPSGARLDSDDHHDDHLHIGPIYQQDANNKIIYLKEKEE